MSPRERQQRIYWRERNGIRRAYGDFRDFADVGGKLEALIGPGDHAATTNPDQALRLAMQRLEALRQARRRRSLTGTATMAALGAYARQYLITRRQSGTVTTEWLEAETNFLARAIAFLGAERPLEEILVRDVRGFAAALRRLPPRLTKAEILDTLALAGAAFRRGELEFEIPVAPTSTQRRGRAPIGVQTIRRHLFALSGVFQMAQQDEQVPVGFNPVLAWKDKPEPTSTPAHFLEVPEAALLLEAARTLPPAEDARFLPPAFVYALVGTFLLSGMRESELLGLELEDVSFDRSFLHVRPNAWRRLKTKGAERLIPLQPQLREILGDWILERTTARGGTLVFPALAADEAMLTNLRPMLDRVGGRIGMAAGAVRTRLFRHTYAAARLQTLDHGEPISLYTVSKELGHSSLKMLEQIYAHLGEQRHRSATLEYRVENHLELLEDRVRRLRIVTRNVTREMSGAPEANAASGVTAGGARDSEMGSARFERATSCSGEKRGERRPENIDIPGRSEPSPSAPDPKISAGDGGSA